jgi:hypothetical protein
MNLSIYRAVIYGCLTTVLSGCSILDPVSDGGVGPKQPGVHSPAAANIPKVDDEVSSQPKTEKNESELGHKEKLPLARLPQEVIETKPQPKTKPPPKKADPFPQTKVTIPPEIQTLPEDDDTFDLWRDEMNQAMEQTAGPQNIHFSPDVQTHHRVRHFVDGFSGPLREFFERALARSGKYISLMADILRKEGIPENLVYLALIESGFSPHAYSRAKAMGYWQFIRSTALRYGLKINSWVDERKDPVLSTRAAAAYLKDLYQMFGEWFLAAAAYNAGEGRVGTALRKSTTNDFWLLRQQRRHLKPETRDYVPKFVAAALIATQPEKYGFENVAYEAPLQFDEVTIDTSLKLETVATLADTDVDVIKELNPALLRDYTPPTDNGFMLRLPVGKGETFLAGYRLLPDSAKIELSLYRVKKGDVLSRIARHHGVSVKQLMKENGLKSWLIRPGQELLIIRSQSAKRK